MKAKRCLASIFLIALLALTIAPTASAASVDVAGMERNTGPGVELYMTSGNLGLSELALLINYDDYDAALKVQSENGSIVQSQIVAPHSSMFIELNFPDLAKYKITVSIQGNDLITLTRERSASVLPPPQDGGWHITPPDTAKPKYTQDFVDDLISALTLETILKATIAAVIGLVAGAIVKRLTLFLTPTDFVTYSITGFAVLDMIFDPFGLGISIYWLPLLCGYFIGHIVTHVDYILPVQTNCAEKTMDVRPVAVYLPDDGSGYCIQIQRNKELLKRWMGIPHRLGTDAGLPQDWTGSFKRPYLPVIRGRLTWVQKSEVKVEPAQIWKFKVKRYTTTYRLAHASGIEKAQWLNEARHYFKLQDMFDRLALKYNDLLLGTRAESTRISAAMVEHAVTVNPARRVSQWFGQSAEPIIDLETGEQTFSEIEEVASEEQEGIARRTAEEDEQMTYERDAAPAERPRKRVRAKNERKEEDDLED
jgi:hypothetical protein